MFAVSAITIYHNPRCSKSRQALALLEEHGVQPDIVLYLEAPPSASDIAGLLKKLGISAAQLVRQGEEEYKACGLSKNASDKDIVAAMARHPKLIERPIVVRGNRAVLGRPPENVLALLD
jgi:arsenate reductase